jgi:hypothetical protein
MNSVQVSALASGSAEGLAMKRQSLRRSWVQAAAMFSAGAIGLVVNFASSTTALAAVSENPGADCPFTLPGPNGALGIDPALHPWPMPNDDWDEGLHFCGYGKHHDHQGPQGDTGAQGNQGDTGPQGSQGDTGAQGTQGDTGPQGTQGDTGAQGTQGDTGPQGTQGDTGAQGTQGDTSPQGTHGETGAQGTQVD